MSFFRSVWRTATVVGMFAGAAAELVVKRPATREQRALWLHRFAKSMMRRLDIAISVEGQFPERGAMISNHLSYLDIVMYASLHPCVFVSKAEIRSWPVVGWMTSMAGTVYVSRGKGGSAERARGEMHAAVNEGLPVVFFPEGTTSDGSGLLSFRSGLLGQFLDEGSPVTPAFVRYSLGAGNDPKTTVANDVCYWGDMGMWSHIFRFLGLRGVKAHVRFGDGPIVFSEGVEDRKQAALEAREAVGRLGGVV